MKKTASIFIISVTAILLTWSKLGSYGTTKGKLVKSIGKLDNTSILTEPSSSFPSSEGLSAIDVILRDCGELCDTDRPGSSGPFFYHIKARVNCDALFKNVFIDRGHGLSEAPREIPEDLRFAYTMNNRLNITTWYLSETYLGTRVKNPVWSFEMVEEFENLARKGTLYGMYGIDETNALIDGLRHASGIQDGRVLVIGSQQPWVEACTLEAGAREVVTLEYGQIISKHPKIKTVIPYQFRMMYLNNTLGKFDAVVTFSSIEHSGLGRYADALNPWGDIIAIARAWCVTKPGGSLTIGVPYDMYDGMSESVVFNAHRIYGLLRYPYLTTNWKQVYSGKGRQKVHVFSKE